ncbi:MAG: hydantoinase/oxoprolinase family protein [Spirochaetales bacterium]|nr:hydantoinase/oxoprolinase family protein [Spirochaetales bacterium]
MGLFRVGVDTGGTFTDCVVIDGQGTIHTFKELSTPKDPSIGLYNVVRKAAAAFGKDLEEFLPELDFFAHGTTVATNTLLTGTGALTGLILTRGFRDTLEMRRAHKENIWDLYLPVPEPLVPRYLRVGVRERIDSTGAVLEPLVPEDVEEACALFRREGVQAVAVCTLFSFLNPVHERAIREIVARELPEAFVSISSEVLPQIREYERSSTTVANAYVGPKLTVYLSTLERRLKADGLGRAFYVTASNGGVMTAETAIRHASATLLSGPAAGAVGAVFFAGLLDRRNLILMDMGGTSFDVTLINNAKVTLSTEGEIAGYRVAKPMIDINTIGAGGGSIAWMDKGGMLKVGPASAGSDPGPVCYALGGTKPTVTDANLCLGYLNPDYFLGGEMKVDAAAAAAALRREIAQPLGMSEAEAAAGVFQIINQNMADATKVVSVQRGHDPREYALVSAGGACSIHACKIAEEVGSRTVLVPRAASVFCALGMLETDIRLDNVRSYNAFIGPSGPGIDLDEFNEVIRQVEAQSLKELLQEGVERERATLLRYLDVRYVGQHHEVTIEIPADRVEDSPHGCSIEERHLQEIAAAFHAAHERLYTYSTPENPLEIMNLRITAVGAVDKATLEAQGDEQAGADIRGALKASRPVYFEQYGDFRETPVYDRQALRPGMHAEGPAVVEERITTVIVHPGWSMHVDRYGNIVMEMMEVKA